MRSGHDLSAGTALPFAAGLVTLVPTVAVIALGWLAQRNAEREGIGALEGKVR